MKKIDLDFTSLLDILLILIFAFIINSNAESSQKEAELAASIESAQQQAASYQAENKKLKAELAEMQTALDNQRTDSQAIKKSMEAMQKELVKMSQNPNISLQTWHNYQVIAKKFLILEISLIAPNNQLVINGKNYPFYISYDELLDEEVKNKKQSALEDIIEKEIDNSVNAGNLILISAGKDVNIPRAVYNFMWETIRKVESKYGKEKLFKTEFYLPESN